MSWTVVPASQFGAQMARWNTLHAAGAASPLLAADFVAALLASFADGRELLAWHDTNGVTDAMTILSPGGFGVWHTFQPSQAPVGLWLQRDDGAPGALLRPLLAAAASFFIWMSASSSLHTSVIVGRFLGVWSHILSSRSTISPPN